MFRKGVVKEKDFSILRIRSDRGGEFINHSFITYCEKIELNMNYHPRTPQQNRVLKRKNRTFQEMVRTMISEYGLFQYYGSRP